MLEKLDIYLQASNPYAKKELQSIPCMYIKIKWKWIRGKPTTINFWKWT